MAVDAQLLCDSFVANYYKILEHNPQQVHKFYKDCSTLCRPDASGVLTTVSAMHGISEKIMSLNENERKVVLKSADALASHDGGVIILVTGSVPGRDFAQTFFLAPQEIGYFVQSDIFRYIDTSEPKLKMSEKEGLIGSQLKEDHPPPAKSAAQSPTTQIKPKPAVSKTNVTRTEESIEKIASQSDLAAHVPASQVESKLAVLEVIPKKSFKTINAAKVASTEASKQPTATTASSVVKNTSDKTTAAALQSGSGASYSIYLGGLPQNLTVSQLEEECRIFGAILPDGVRVKTKPDGFAFGFVEFVHESSVQKALKASPIVIQDKPAYVQIKRGSLYGGGAAGGNTNARDGYGGGGGNGRDGYYRNESFRGRQNDGYWGGYSDGDYQRGYNSNAGGDYQRGYYSKTGGISVRQEDRRTWQDKRTGVPPNRGRLR